MELLIVIGIIGILASVVLVSYKGHAEKARLANTMQWAKSVHSELGAYAVGGWSFDNIFGNTVYDDSSNGNNGTIYGATQVDGVMGKALSFDGNDYVEITDGVAFDITQTGFTYAAWIKPSSFLNTYNMFMGHSLPYFNVRFSRNLHMSMRAAGAQRSVYGVTLLDANTWYYAVATYDGNGYMKVYLNGKQEGVAGPFLIPVNYNSNFYIGQYNSGGAYRFTGLIDDVRIYKESLTQAQIQQHYAEGLKTHQSLAQIENSQSAYQLNQLQTQH